MARPTFFEAPFEYRRFFAFFAILLTSIAKICAQAPLKSASRASHELLMR